MSFYDTLKSLGDTVFLPQRARKGARHVQHPPPTSLILDSTLLLTSLKHEMCLKHGITAQILCIIIDYVVNVPVIE